MRFTWTHVVLGLMVARVSLASESEAGFESERKVKVEDNLDQDTLLDLDEELKDDIENSNLPVLPPLILLDFTNGTNSTSEEKSKRTIDGNLGYGFQGNNIFSGKYNYYFPAGKSGTTVSIEESISPFSPKTIVERVKPITEEPENLHQYDKDRIENYSYSNNAKNPSSVYTQAIFGQRTRLQKTTSNFGSYAGSSTTPRTHLIPYTTGSPELSSSTGHSPYDSFSTTAQPTYQSTIYSAGENYRGSTTESSIQDGQSTPESLSYITPAAYRANHNFKPYNSRTKTPSTTSSHKKNNPTGNYYSSPIEELSQYPRYTIENGVKYEHRIIWKYPDGRVVNSPPPIYENSDSPTTNYQNFRYNSQQSNYQTSQQMKYSPATQSLYSQKPAQFPNQEPEDQKNNPFISSANENFRSSDSSLDPYDVVYSNSYNAKQNTRNSYLASSTGTRSSQRNPYSSLNTVRPVQKYAVNSPNPEYVGITENPGKSVTSKYSPEVQNYLNKILAIGKTPGKNSFGSKNIQPQYADLLKYNPSISQYIKNPSSILNAQPTFVQAGNSLIPVIILRVDGAPPAQPKATPNINLKALLQQYLTQYAHSLNDMSQDSTYDLGNDNYARSQTSGGSNPISDLTQLTQSLSKYSQNPGFSTDYQNKYFQNNRYDRKQYKPSGYAPILNQGQRQQDDETKIVEAVNRYTSQGRKSQKVQSVEIIGGPRYTSYKSS